MNKWYKMCMAAAMLVGAASVQAQTARVVINAKGDAAFYLGEDATRYHVMAQDDGWVDKASSRVETWTPQMGKGCVAPAKSPQSAAEGPVVVNIRKAPTTRSVVVGRMVAPYNEIPLSGACLGKKGRWYKVNYEGVVGYVRDDVAAWDPLCAE